MNSSSGKQVNSVAKSIGGGMINFTKLDEYVVDLEGKSYEYVVLMKEQEMSTVIDWMISDGQAAGSPMYHSAKNRKLYQIKRLTELDPEIWARIKDVPRVLRSWACDPVFYVQRGEQLFASCEKIFNIAKARGYSLGQMTLLYESKILGLDEADILKEIGERFQIMKSSIILGKNRQNISMQLLYPVHLSVPI
jgi:hypothetical protein